MRSSFNGRNRGKSVSFRSSNEEPFDGDSNNREVNVKEFKPVDAEESRTVKLLPDANMTISVHNDFRDIKNKLRGRGSQSIVKSFRDDSTFVYNTEQNSQYSNRGFETYNNHGRGRGRPRGLYHGYQSGEYDQDYVHDFGNQRNYRNRPLSGSYDYNHEYNGHYYGRQSTDYGHSYNNKNQDYQHGPKNYRATQSSANYETENDTTQDQQHASKNFRGRSKSASDRTRRGRGGRGQFRERFSKDNEDGNGGRKSGEDVVSGDGHKDDTQDSGTPWLSEEAYHTSTDNGGHCATTANNESETYVPDESQKSTELNADEIEERITNTNVTNTNEEAVKSVEENVQNEVKVELHFPDEAVKE